MTVASPFTYSPAVQFELSTQVDKTFVVQPRERFSTLEQFQSNSCAFLGAKVVQFRQLHDKLFVHANDPIVVCALPHQVKIHNAQNNPFSHEIVSSDDTPLFNDLVI